MPFEIVRNDIVNMQVDAVVNTANPETVIGTGVDSVQQRHNIIGNTEQLRKSMKPWVIFMKSV